MGGGTQTTTQSQQMDPQLKALYLQNFSDASNLADQPFTPYTGERVAPFSATQQAGQAALLSAANDPTAANDIARAKTAATGLLDFTPQTVTGSTIKPGMLKDADISAYMNPYLDDVLNSTLSTLSHAKDMQDVSDKQSATAAKAFGGSRQGVQAALTNDDYLRNVASTTSNLRSAAYDKAVTAAQSDLDRATNADEFNANQAYDASKTNATNSMSAAGLRLNAGSSLANLSNQELTQALQRAGVLEGVGAEQTNQNQSMDDASYEEFMRQLGYPIQAQNIKNSALGMIPVQQSTTSTTKSNPGLLGMLGTGASIASLFI